MVINVFELQIKTNLLNDNEISRILTHTVNHCARNESILNNKYTQPCGNINGGREKCVINLFY